MNKRELKKEIRKLNKFLNFAAFENPFNLSADLKKLEKLKEELKNA